MAADIEELTCALEEIQRAIRQSAAAQVAAVTREATSSIEIQRSKDGIYYWTLKQYFDASDPNEAKAAFLELAAIDKRLRVQYLPKGS